MSTTTQQHTCCIFCNGLCKGTFIYKCRVEILPDAYNFLYKVIRNRQLDIKGSNITSDDFCGAIMEFTSHDSLKRVKTVLGLFPNLHVMEETVQFKDDYTGVRTRVR